MSDLLSIVALSLACCAGTGLLGGLLLHLLRGRSLRYPLVIVALLPVLAVVVTVLVDVRLMFLSAHDSTVVLVGLLSSAVLAVVAAGLVLRRLTSASRQVGAGLQQLVRDSTGAVTPYAPGPGPTPTGGPVPAELAAVLTELAETRRTLADSRARERAAEDARRELVAFMSHDLRTPLSGLRALAEALEDDMIADVPRALGHLRGTVTRMAALVDDLFALSRVQGTQAVKPATLVSLTELVDDVAAESVAAARAQQVELDVSVPSTDRLAVLGSSDDLARALTNLVSNAIRHTDPGRRVRLEASRAEDGRVLVAVADGCGGIPDANLGRVFDTGWRGTPSRSGDDGGAGLGLAITRGVVESHAGRIAVQNVSGGCRFEVELPRPTASGEAADR